MRNGLNDIAPPCLSPDLPPPSRTRKWPRRAASAFALSMLLLAGFLAYLGYFGGPVFTVVPASNSAPTPAARAGLGAVVLSGDMGFHVGMAPRIATRLAADGIPVIGVNSLSYFRVRRSPAENEALIADAMHRALAQPGVRRVALIGQSFGADMLHAGLPALPASLRDKVPLVALVVPGDTIEFRASPAELFSLAASDAPAMRSAGKLDWVPVTCIHGAEEANSLCPLLTLPNVQTVTLPGGHPLKRDVDRVYETLARAIREASGG